MIPEFDATSYQEIEAEVQAVLNRSNIVTPDDVRGNYSSLSDAVLPSRGLVAGFAAACIPTHSTSLNISIAYPGVTSVVLYWVACYASDVVPLLSQWCIPVACVARSHKDVPSVAAPGT